jgi:hypothetical protein
MTRHTKKHLRKQKRAKKYTRAINPNKIPDIYIQNFGSTKTRIKTKNKESEREIKWLGDYNGEEAKLQLDVINDNERKVYNIKMNNEQLSQLLGVHPVNIPLEERLRNDLLVNNAKQRDGEQRDGEQRDGEQRNIQELLVAIPNKHQSLMQEQPIQEQPLMQEKSLSTDVPLFLQNNKVLLLNPKNGANKRKTNKMSKK